MNLDDELMAIRSNILANHADLIYITQDQFALGGLVNQCLRDKSRENRYRCLVFLLDGVPENITGVRFTGSMKQLTSPIASYLIELFKDPEEEKWKANEYAKELFDCIETSVEVAAVR